MQLNKRFRVHSELDKLVFESLVALSNEKGDLLDDLKRHCGLAELQDVFDHESVELTVDASFSDFTFNCDKVIRKTGFKLF
jgi:hypothetical protein